MSISTHAPVGSHKREADAPEAPSAPETAAHETTVHETTWELVDFDRYVVTHGGPVGYIDVVPPLFVCHLGHPYAKAFEIAQVHDLERATRIVAEAASSDRSPTAS